MYPLRVGHHDPKLVVLSVTVAVIASYAALDLAARVSVRRGRAAWLWLLLGGAAVMGTGIWSMHFVGMLAFDLGGPVAYDGRINAASWLVAVLASGMALLVARRPALTRSRLAGGGLVMGLGIAAMHYLGMAAMRVSPPVEYDIPLVAASIGIAFLSSLAALTLAFRLRRRYSRGAVFAKLGSAVVLGLGIAAMHYTGMAAARFAPGTVSLVPPSLTRFDDAFLAELIGVAALGLLGVTVVLSAFDAARAARTEALALALQARNEQLRAAALYDALTGLPNRVLLDERLIQAVRRSERSGKPFAVMFVDLDRFKSVNDAYGHDVGDRLLKAVSERMQSCVRGEDTVARAGGDEFIVVLAELGRGPDAGVVGEKMLKELARPFQVGPRQLDIGASIGISIYPGDARDVKTLLLHADAAMYHAKHAGRNQLSFFAPGMAAGA
ncbi:MAG TPA: diguanylate cyclase [Verrucomicrobiae bacterium]|nr:diguanylate cyclase [Verrucomicrobiae bacterium]